MHNKAEDDGEFWWFDGETNELVVFLNPERQEELQKKLEDDIKNTKERDKND
jgi:hypothetical protein